MRCITACMFLLACQPESEAAPEDSGPLDTGALVSGDLCVDAPVTTWANFGEGFVIEHCQACHRSTSATRQGAPEAVFFDTEADVMAWSDRVVARAVDDLTMPPQGGVDADARSLLEIWLTCDPK